MSGWRRCSAATRRRARSRGSRATPSTPMSSRLRSPCWRATATALRSSCATFPPPDDAGRAARRALPYPRRHGLPAAPQPAADRADRDPQSHRLDGAPDDARRGRPADRRLRRLPRGARRGRRRPDLHRGHRGAPERAPHRPHDRGLRPARRRAAGPRRRRGARGRGEALRPALPRRARADRRTAARARGRALGGAEPALQGRAARAQLARDRGDRRAPRARGRQRPRGRARRDRAVRLARLPAHAVPERAHQPARRRLGRRCRAAPALRARGAARHAARRRPRDGRRHPAVGRRDAAGGPPCAGDREHPAHARRRRPDRLRERGDRRLGQLSGLGLDRAAAARRPRRDARARRASCAPGSPCR